MINPDVLLMTAGLLPEIFTPTLAALPEAVPVSEIAPFPVVVDTVEAAPIKLIPCDEAALAPPVPLSVIVPPPLVFKLPPVSDIPWQLPVTPFADAVIAIVPPVVEKV